MKHKISSNHCLLTFVRKSLTITGKQFDNFSVMKSSKVYKMKKLIRTIFTKLQRNLQFSTKRTAINWEKNDANYP